ncbi:hypothetical protein LIER_37798 [Lithospermum erythrorhizon]|uniref:Uncharacterized protein n=1 Tax=Lithospermum erythrorhizon TaxID=34254 RepID=A0AAV3PVX1_LITER
MRFHKLVIVNQDEITHNEVENNVTPNEVDKNVVSDSLPDTNVLDVMHDTLANSNVVPTSDVAHAFNGAPDSNILPDYQS